MWKLQTAALAAIGIALCVPAQAEVFKDKSRVNICTPLPSEDVFKRPDGSVVRKTGSMCISTADLPFPFDQIRLLCSAVTDFAADGKVVSSHGFCDGTSTKGDRYASWTVWDAVNLGRWGYFDGSGAYAGIKGGGTYKTRTAFPGGGAILDVIGSWQVDGATASK